MRTSTEITLSCMLFYPTKIQLESVVGSFKTPLYLCCNTVTVVCNLLQNLLYCKTIPLHYIVFLHRYKMGYYTPLLLLTKAVILQLFCLSDVHGILITEYYTEFDNTTCPGEPCHTLNYFASNTPNAWLDVVVRFLPGNHSLNRSLYISSNSNLHLTTLDPVTSTQNLNVNSYCPGMANFHFYVSNVTIYGLGFYNCGEYSTSGTLYFQHAIHLWVDYIKIQSWHTYTTAIQVNNGSGRLIISHSEFLNCNVVIGMH